MPHAMAQFKKFFWFFLFTKRTAYFLNLLFDRKLRLSQLADFLDRHIRRMIHQR
jgi:hypothetical protein